MPSLPTRKKFAEALKREQALQVKWTSKFARGEVSTLDPGVWNGARELVRDTRAKDEQNDPTLGLPKWLESFGGRSRKMSEQEQLKLVAMAYATWVLADEDEGIRSVLVQHLARSRKKFSSRTTLLHASTEIFLKYEGYRGSSNRDVQAIRYLVMKGVPPSGVQELALRKGEGLDPWSRRAAAGEIGKLASTQSVQGESQGESDGTHSLEWIRDGASRKVNLPNSGPLLRDLEKLFLRFQSSSC